MRPFLALGYCSHGFRYRLQSRDTTQDTRPVCGLLQGQGVRLESIRSPSLRQTNKKGRPSGGLFYLSGAATHGPLPLPASPRKVQ